MSRARRVVATLAMRVFLIIAAVVAMVAFGVAGRRLARTHVAAAEEAVTPRAEVAARPIAAEAEVFRTDLGMLAIGSQPSGRRPAHPRTLATYRALRAYPGAPPRIPHGLTPAEFREGACLACHERGGFSQRFNAYVPVTPHPDLGECLQCHIGNATLMAIPLPGTDPNSRCRQCHTAGGPGASDSTLDWRAGAWPRLARVTPGQAPPPIPHDAPTRVNCIACHAGPAAVAEIRTPHPERSNCRQCHVHAGAAANVVLVVGHGADGAVGGPS